MAIIKLETWEYEYASHIGIRRFTANWDKEDAQHYQDDERKEDDRTAQVASAIGELAVAKLVNQFWHATIWSAQKHNEFKKLPDVGRNIEVRRVRTQDAVCIRKKDTGRGLIVFAVRPIEKEFTEVEVFGFIDADEGFSRGKTVEYGNVFSLKDLRTDFSWFEEITV
jgi:hypothetical protein